MDFDLEKDFKIFDPLFEKRPELSAENLKQDLTRYYLPYAKKLIELKSQKNNLDGLIVGVSAIQGAGKSTQGEVLEILLEHFGHSTDSRSIDDHYITHRELCALRDKDPRYIRRGVTHDISLAILDLRDMQKMQDDQPILVSSYDKGAHHGDGDRFRWVNPVEGITLTAKVVTEELVVDKKLQSVQAMQLVSLSYNNIPLALSSRMGSDIPLTEPLLPQDLIDFLKTQTGEITLTTDGENATFSGTGQSTASLKDLPNGWRLINKKPDFIFYDGWMLGARQVMDESIFDNANLPSLETAESRQFAKDINRKLENYEILWQMFEFFSVLYVPNYQMSLQWRDQAEEALRAKGEGMTHEQITEFVHYFWRSVHPAIHIKNLALDTDHTQQVVIINDDHSIKEILRPDQTLEKYP